jgi:hypothetical protein
MTRQSVTRTASLAAVVAALAAAPAGAQQDLRSPDARDAAKPGQIVLHRSGYVVFSNDLRSPDARDAAVRAETSEVAPVVRTDLRSPDARDAANHVSTASVRAIPVSSVDGSDFQWGDAGIGAGIVAGLTLVLGLTAVAVRHRHHSLPTA